MQVLSEKLCSQQYMQFCCFLFSGDRYNADPKSFDDAYDEFEDKTTKKSSFRKFRERSYSGKEYHDDASNKRYSIGKLLFFTAFL